jgi:Xaa-Pro aminopeptidase
MKIKNRVGLLIEKLAEKDLNGILITKEQNVSYLSGFTGSESSLLLTAGKKFFLTDFRYLIQAKRELKGFKIIQTKNSFLKDISDLCNELKIKRLGFESGNVAFKKYLTLKKLSRGIKLISTTDAVENFRKIKTNEELNVIKKVAKLTLSCLSFIKSKIMPGVREKDFAATIEYFIKTHGGDGPAFKTIVASGSNSVMPHAITSGRIIKRNDSVLIDFGIRSYGYNSDLTRIFSLGKINTYFRKIYSIVKDAQRIAIDYIKPGVRISEIEMKVRDYLDEKGLEKFFGHSLGHGIGREVHELPKISRDNRELFKENMVFTVEPGVYIPKLAGFRHEDMVVVTKYGCEVLTQ